MTTQPPRLHVLAGSYPMVHEWAAAEGIPRLRVIPLTCQGDLKRLRGANSINLYRHPTWAYAPMDVVHEIQYYLAHVKTAGGTVTEVTTDEQLDQFRTVPQQERPMSEADFQTRVIDYAKLRGWMLVHYRPARTATGTRTPLAGDKGCPDLILARHGRVLLIELKSQQGRVRPEQKAWLAHLGEHGHLYRPNDWPALQELLT